MPSEWDKNSAGNIVLTPLIRFQTAHLHETGVGLRLELSSDPAEPNKPSVVVQAAMTIEQAAELIAQLQLVTDYILSRRPVKPAN